MKKLLLSLLALGMLSGTARIVAAEDAKPMAVVSVTNFAEAMKTAQQIATLAGQPQATRMLGMMLGGGPGGGAPAGLDEKRPIVAIIFAPAEDKVIPFVYVPVTDLKKLLDALKPLLGEVKSSGDATYSVKLKGQDWIVKEKGAWAVVGPADARFDHAPADPTALVGDLNKQYVVGWRVLAANVPASLRGTAMAPLMMAAAAGNVRLPGENEATFAGRRAGARSLQQVTDIVNDLDQTTLGLALDSAAKKLRLDLALTFTAGSKAAKRCEFQGAEGKSAFGGFLPPGAALTVGCTHKLHPDDVEITLAAVQSKRDQLLKGIQPGSTSLTEEQAQKLRQAVGDLIDVFQETIKAGMVDGAVSLLADPKAVTLVAGVGLAGTGASAKLDKSLRDLVELIGADEPGLKKLIKFDAETAGGVHFHTVSVPLPGELPSRDKIVAMVGETLDLVVGIGDRAVYLAAGRNSLATLKQAIEKSASGGSTAAPLWQFSLAAGPIVKTVAASTADNPFIMMLTAPLLTALGAAPGQDHLTLVGSSIEHGTQLRLELEQGMLTVVGMAGTMASGGGGASGGAGPIFDAVPATPEKPDGGPPKKIRDLPSEPAGK